MWFETTFKVLDEVSAACKQLNCLRVVNNKDLRKTNVCLLKEHLGRMKAEKQKNHCRDNDKIKVSFGLLITTELVI